MGVWIIWIHKVLLVYDNRMRVYTMLYVVDMCIRSNPSDTMCDPRRIYNRLKVGSSSVRHFNQEIFA